jgi:hypothetical protein
VTDLLGDPARPPADLLARSILRRPQQQRFGAVLLAQSIFDEAVDPCSEALTASRGGAGELHSDGIRPRARVHLELEHRDRILSPVSTEESDDTFSDFDADESLDIVRSSDRRQQGVYANTVGSTEHDSGMQDQ